MKEFKARERERERLEEMPIIEALFLMSLCDDESEKVNFFD